MEAQFNGHKIISDKYYCIRGNVIDLEDIESIVPEYHNNHRSIYLKVIKKNKGKNIIKMQNKQEYNYTIKAINLLTKLKLEEI